MKKILLPALLVLALTACSPEQLSTEETCSEANAIVAGADSGNDDEVREVGEQLGDLAQQASDPLKDELTLLAEVASGGQEGQEEIMNDPERSAEYQDAADKVSEVCDF